MAQNLHYFNTETAFNEAYHGDGYIEPWVSYTDEIEGGEHVDYNRYDPSNGHPYVNLGLPSGTLWSTLNLGSSDILEMGDAYAWGELETKSNYTWDTYAFGTSSNLTKYNATDGLMDLELEDDVARTLWGGEWEIPASNRVEELNEYCTTSYETISGVTFQVFTSNINGKKLYFRPTGYKFQTNDYETSYFYFWTKSVDLNGSDYSKGGKFTNYPSDMAIRMNRCSGLYIRPVIEMHPR